MAERPVALLCAMFANANRDSKKRPKAYDPWDFWQFGDRPDGDAPFNAATGAAAIELRRRDLLPDVVLSVWPQLVASVEEGKGAPDVVALSSDDGTVWVLAPTFEASGIRGGLVAVMGQQSGLVMLRDVDRKLLTYEVRLPERNCCGWVSSGHLLLGT
jgi:hypothetical protein